MRQVILKINKATSKQAIDLAMQVVTEGKLTEAEWEILYNEGVVKRPTKKKRR